MYKISILVISISLTIMTISCKKSEDMRVVATPSAITANISISSPYAQQSFKTGDTIKIHANITAEAKLHGCHTVILNKQGDTLFNKENHTHGMEISVDEIWINTLDSNTELYLKIICIEDHDGKTSEKTQVFKINNN